jgi:hypothetical protein
MYGQGRVRTLVVFVQPEMWDAIDGETLMVLLAEMAEILPEIMRLVHEGQEVVVVDYEI